MKKEYKKSYNEAKKVFQKLDYIFSGIHWGNYFKELYDISYQEEKNHRNGRSKAGLTIKEASIYFSIKDFAECVQCVNPVYAIKNVLHVKKRVILAHSIYLNYPEEVKKAFEGINFELLNNFDYAEAMKTE